MRVIFSRIGFDSSAGGGPSPIVDGRPLSLPIPDTKGFSRTTYGDLGLGEYAAQASRGKLGARDLCHHDPMFRQDGTCVFGQHSAAQTHLERHGVGRGDVFIFFGLFADEETREPHHRIFGYLRVEEIISLGAGAPEELVALGHPLRGGKLQSVARGQEFVADIGRRQAPQDWLESVIAEIKAS